MKEERFVYVLQVCGNPARRPGRRRREEDASLCDEFDRVSPPHRRDSPKDLGMGKKGKTIGVEVGMKGPRELRDQTRGKEDRMRTTKKEKGNAGRGHRHL